MNKPVGVGKYQPFVIVGVQRTGSSALAEYISTHPAIATGWEWSERTRYHKKIDLLERSLGGDFALLGEPERVHIESEICGATRHLGFRRLFGASNKWAANPAWSLKLFADRFFAHMSWLRAHPEVRIIHIVRDDHVEWLKSKFVAAHMDSFVGTAYPDNVRIKVPLRNAIARVRSKIWIDTALAHLAATNPYQKLCYETFAEEMVDVGERVVEFLGEDPALLDKSKMTIKRQSTKPTSEYLSNYSALLGALENAGIKV